MRLKPGFVIKSNGAEDDSGYTLIGSREYSECVEKDKYDFMCYRGGEAFLNLETALHNYYNETRNNNSD